MAGKYYEELTVGTVLRYQPGRTVTEADNIWFSCLTMNPQTLHVDFHAAAKAEFGRPLVNSLFTLGVAVGRDVTRNGDRAVAEARQLVRQGLEPVDAARGEHDVGAAAGKLSRERRADPGRRPGDENGPADERRRLQGVARTSASSAYAEAVFALRTASP